MAYVVVDRDNWKPLSGTYFYLQDAKRVKAKLIRKSRQRGALQVKRRTNENTVIARSVDPQVTAEVPFRLPVSGDLYRQDPDPAPRVKRSDKTIDAAYSEYYGGGGA